MGTMLRLSCPCGYESDDLHLGSGMLQGPERVAAHCRHCRTIIAVAEGKRLRCSKCRRKPELLDPRLAEPEDGARQYVCPWCGKPHLQPTPTGIWD